MQAPWSPECKSLWNSSLPPDEDSNEQEMLKGQGALAAFISNSPNGLIKYLCRRVLLCVEFDLLGTKEEQAHFHYYLPL